MVVNNIYKYIHHPELIDSKTFREFDEILDKYPYFQLVRILYLRALYVQNSHRFQQELKNATLYISDKKQLYLYLSGQLDIDNLVDTNTKFVPENAIEEHQPEKATATVEAIPEKETLIVEETIKKETETKEEELTIERKEEENQGKFINTTAEEHKKPLETVSEDERTTEIVYESSKENYTKSESVISTETEDSLSSIPSLDNGDIIDFDTSKEDTEEQRAIQKNDLLDLIMNEMNVGSAYTLENSLGVKPDNDYDIDKLGKELHDKQKEKLIDDFIDNDPDIPKPDKSGFTNINLAELSSHDDSCMTETLAKIYLKQHLYAKAISVYRKLSLKNPQKSVYFVEKISEIKKIINDKL